MPAAGSPSTGVVSVVVVSVVSVSVVSVSVVSVVSVGGGGAGGGAGVPSTVSGVAVVSPSYPQAVRPAASASAMTAAMTGTRRIDAESNRSNVHSTP